MGENMTKEEAGALIDELFELARTSDGPTVMQFCNEHGITATQADVDRFINAVLEGDKLNLDSLKDILKNIDFTKLDLSAFV